MRYSSYNWAARGRRGWIFGPLFGVTVEIRLDRGKGHRPVTAIIAGLAHPRIPKRATNFSGGL